ncbi:1528_t:CDS:10, partial [Entrophospora sp. SA101]
EVNINEKEGEQKLDDNDDKGEEVKKNDNDGERENKSEGMVDDVETSTSSSHETSIPDHSTSSSKTLKKRKEIVGDDDNEDKSRRLSNYKVGMEIDPKLLIQETNEVTAPYSECSFNYISWKIWRLKSGSVVTDLLEKLSRTKGHPLRSEVWNIIHCGFKIVKPKWCNDEEYAEIQSFTKRPSFKSLPKHIIELLKKSLGSLGFEIKKFKLNTNIYFLEEIPKSKGNDQFSDDLEKIRLTFSTPYPEDPFTTFFIKILSLLHKYVFMEDSILQKPDISEANYGEVGHLEMSGGYKHKDIPRSTWDGCCKLPIGNSYMLEEIGEQFRSVFPETFSKLRVFSLHTYKNWIELWQMHNPACGVLQYERLHKSIVPICYEEHRAGTLGIPYAIQQGGWITILFLILTAVMTTYANIKFIEFLYYNGSHHKNPMSELAYDAFGRVGLVVVEFFSMAGIICIPYILLKTMKDVALLSLLVILVVAIIPIIDYPDNKENLHDIVIIRYLPISLETVSFSYVYIAILIPYFADVMSLLGALANGTLLVVMPLLFMVEVFLME